MHLEALGVPREGLVVLVGGHHLDDDLLDLALVEPHLGEGLLRHVLARPAAERHVMNDVMCHVMSHALRHECRHERRQE